MCEPGLETKLGILHTILVREGIDEVLESKSPEVIKVLQKKFRDKIVFEHIEDLKTKDEEGYRELLTEIRDFFLGEEN